jgi:hypothetical protein
MKLSMLAESNIFTSHRVPAWHPLWLEAQGQRIAGASPEAAFMAKVAGRNPRVGSLMGAVGTGRAGRGTTGTGRMKLADFKRALAGEGWWSDVYRWLVTSGGMSDDSRVSWESFLGYLRSAGVAGVGPMAKAEPVAAQAPAGGPSPKMQVPRGGEYTRSRPSERGVGGRGVGYAYPYER